MSDLEAALQGLDLEDVKRLSFAHLGKYDLPALCRILLAEALDEARSDPTHEVNTLPAGAVDKISQDDSIRNRLLDK